jgi:predicted NAD/FAD-dependent oxidoreductase
LAQIAVIGAGLAGLACARALTAAGHAVTVLDKGRGPGGRLSTRRAETPLGQAHFDHGAQFLTARDPTFATVLADWVARGVAAPWPGEVANAGLTAAGALELTPAAGTRARYIGVPGMNALIRDMATGLDVRFGKRVTALNGGPGAWQLSLEDGGSLGPFDAVAVAVPAEQVSTLLAPHAPALAAPAETVRSLPCWAVMAVWEAPVPVTATGLYWQHPVLAWTAHDGAKPGRGGLNAWTLHASADWSTAHLEDPAEAVASAVVTAFTDATGAPPPVWATAHRWRYARVEAPAPADPTHGPCGWDGAMRLGTCGDWHGGERGEAAWLSGAALGAAMVAAL